MGFFKAVPFFTGAAKEGVDIFNEAEQIGKESISILKEAKEEVQDTINTVSNNYDKAISLADNAGGGAFGKYLFIIACNKLPIDVDFIGSKYGFESFAFFKQFNIESIDSSDVIKNLVALLSVTITSLQSSIKLLHLHKTESTE